MYRAACLNYAIVLVPHDHIDIANVDHGKRRNPINGIIGWNLPEG